MTTPTTLPKGYSHWRFILDGGCAESCPDTNRQHKISTIVENVAKALAEGLAAKDVVVLAVSALEDCPVFNVGHGTVLNQDGIHQLEAGIVDGHAAGYGAVGCTETTMNLILFANELLDHLPHTMIVGRGANHMAAKLGFSTVANSYFTTPFWKAYWEKTASIQQDEVDSYLGTVGAVVPHVNGHLAAGESIGGSTGKRNGRIGNTAVLGAGLYADTQLSVAWGTANQILKHMLAANVAKCYASSHGLREAARQALHEVARAATSCAVAAIDAEDNSIVESTAPLFSLL